MGPKEVRDLNNPLQLSLQLRHDIAPSVNSRLIRCDYYIDCIFVANGTFVSNLHVKVPVTIYAPQPPAEQFILQLPPGWANAQIMPAVSVMLPTINAAMLPSAPAISMQMNMPQVQVNFSENAPLIQSQPQPQYVYAWGNLCLDTACPVRCLSTCYPARVV